ncbi:MAG: hypothetical protein HKN00_04750 [Flavobacteriaceae bacterium]|nr:hypothetical protein [Bacteroidia bacterium]MBT8288625.1 hypothetical protein [Bacteroidia bacterium]NNF74471.1 hypothetical protein [Flavobacteriaceae bacterium]NNK74344.1 hypothetical protein [Flavobacteriaceae bacterium]
MKRYFLLLMLSVVSTLTFGVSLNNTDPLNDYLTAEIERLELEQDLFGLNQADMEAYSIAAIAVYEIDEDVEIEFNTVERLPLDFNAKQGLPNIDWNNFKLFELDEELENDATEGINIIGS